MVCSTRRIDTDTATSMCNYNHNTQSLVGACSIKSQPSFETKTNVKCILLVSSLSRCKTAISATWMSRCKMAISVTWMPQCNMAISDFLAKMRYWQDIDVNKILHDLV